MAVKHDLTLYVFDDGAITIDDNTIEHDAFLDLDDPANAAIILDVCRALQRRCPDLYGRVYADAIFAPVERPASRRPAAGDGQQ